MGEALVALISVVGTLAAVVVTGFIQRRTAVDSEKGVERQRLAERRAEALADFSRSLIDYRRVELQCWYEVDAARRAGRRLDPDAANAAEGVRAARSASWGDYYRLRLLWDDFEVIKEARALLHGVSALERMPHKDAAKAQADTVREDLGKLADKARERLAPERFRTT